MATIPANIGFGKVVGQFLTVLADAPSGDEDEFPDISVPTGSITFTPAVSTVKNASIPVTLTLRPIVCGLDSEGFLLAPNGNRGVYLVATDDTDINPSGWTWTVTIALANSLSATFALSVPQGSTQDLTLLTPVATSPGIQTVVGPRGPEGPPGSGGTLTVFYVEGSGWPDRPTDRTDVSVHWVGGDENTPPEGAAVGVDIWDRPIY